LIRLSVSNFDTIEEATQKSTSDLYGYGEVTIMRRRSLFGMLGMGAAGAALSRIIHPRSASGDQATVAGCSEFPEMLTVSSSPEDHCDPWIELDMSNLAWNIRETRKRIGKRPILAVVKCNAYGHGLVEMSQGMAGNGISHFAVVKVWEAVSLREKNIGNMVLNLGPFSRMEAVEIVKHDISQSVYTDAVEVLAEAARKQQKRVKVHIKIDTALGRIGIPMTEAGLFIEKVAALPEIQIEGVMTVMTGKKKIPSQIRDFMNICDAAENKGISLGYRHSASSKDVAENPETYMDMVRPGSCLCGLEPLPNMKVRPVLSFKTRVILVKSAPAGSEIGWNNEYPMEKDTLFALLPVGYYDGFSPNVSGKADVLIKGNRYPVSAFISADHTFIDITGSNNIAAGDEVVIIGKQGREEITNSEISKQSQRSVYRTPTYLNPHMPRLKVNT
jgi:alanine racemase